MMKQVQWIPVVMAVLLAHPVYAVGQIAPRFPDTELPAPGGGDVMARQGEVYISGTLLVSPCVLSDWATEMQSRNWVSGRARKVTLALEGCGTGETTTGLASGYGTPLHATGRWGRAEAFPLRLKNGVNYLTLPAPAGVEGIRLEMSYE
ncbi:TPA: hypothetical protein G8L55_004547 [Salmonella enterica]|uniref:Uncharacterized protein n=1 Tax=Salmonella enterica TaxID=28901 RepID=A0A742SYQ5_SALER|nr:hypothetical protein [Salmonella enterica subsp. enterica serovar Newport]HAF1519446.1 hypothetical protein [Salmonella enterica]HAF2586047.1 hypothetical protein [Salmonella enterica]HAF6120459.1 hypothetical protein [Salmonella enterica]HAK8085314.1 hypothetical protein [Salmonella enterica]